MVGFSDIVVGSGGYSVSHGYTKLSRLHVCGCLVEEVVVAAVHFHCKGRQYDNVSDGSCDGVEREPAAVPLLIPNRCPLGERSQLGGGLGSARLGSRSRDVAPRRCRFTARSLTSPFVE